MKNSRIKTLTEETAAKVELSTYRAMGADPSKLLGVVKVPKYRAGSFCPQCYAAQKAGPDFKDAEAYRRRNWGELLMNVTFEPLSRSEWFSSIGGPAFQALNGFPHPIRVLVFREAQSEE